ncbi:autotransporter outer membrane beta-barrel domain-containing protein [Brucella sp. NBRC 12950]|uniref:autotransporter outer membrane beta-barrel domain-containing protein n=1 Tax=Brucella sp. NBRC 12950 TaxID=2994518 RepID=UPI0024A1647E|nr:autotransporter outer membrane beta-barrel domain-containing protein [Brucella sp. NBRC 12950]GLU29496.1 autotransporter [Brucella sp. NBRC 12950]
MLRGGRVGKYKGIAGGIAPCEMGSSLTSTVVATVLSLGGAFLSSTTAFAGGCVTTGSNTVCSGPASVSDTTRSISGSNISVTTSPGFGHATQAGNAFTIQGNGGTSFIDTNAATISGQAVGLAITNNNPGKLIVQSNGQIIGNSTSNGIVATAGVGTTSVDINVLDVSGYGGVSVNNLANIDTTITSTGKITATSANNGFGVLVTGANSASGSTTIRVNDVVGGQSGVVANVFGAGDATVIASGSIVTQNAFSGSGISVNGNVGMTGDIKVEANSINAAAQGITVGKRGAGNVSIAVTGSIEAGSTGLVYEDGFGFVYAGDTNVDISVADISAGSYGVLLTNRGSNNGTLNLTSTGTVSSKTTSGIRAVHYGSLMTMDVNNVSGRTIGIDALVWTGGRDLEISARGNVVGETAQGINVEATAGSRNVVLETNNVTGATDGIRVEANGTGAVQIASTGSVTGTSADGIYAYNGSTTSDLTIDTVDVTGGRYGIAAYNYGKGSTSISSTSDVTGKANNGIYVYNGGATTELTIDVADVNGRVNGIEANNNGLGSTSIAATGAINSEINTGIYVNNGGSTTGLAVDVVDVTAGGNGIDIRSSGSGVVDINSSGLISSGTNGIYAIIASKAEGLDIDVNDIKSGTQGVWIDYYGSGDVGIDAHNIVSTGGEGINIETTVNSNDLVIDVNDVTSLGSAIRFNHAGVGDTIVNANDIKVTNGHGIWFNTWGSGDVKVGAHDIDVSGIGVWLDTASTTKNLDIAVNSITSGDDGINAIHSGDGTVNISAQGSIVSGDDAIEFYADNANVKQINVDVNNAKGADYGIYVVSNSSANDPADPDSSNNDVNVSVTGQIQSGAGAAISTQTNAGVLSNITVGSNATVSADSGLAIVNNGGDSHVVVANGGVVNGSISLNAGTDTVDLYGGFSGITSLDGGTGDDQLTLHDADSSYDGSKIQNWEIFTLDNSRLELTNGSLAVGAAGDAATGVYLTNSSTLDGGAALALAANLTVDASSSFVATGSGTGVYTISGGVNNSGLITTQDNLAGDVVTIAGNYSGDNGRLSIDTALGDDSSTTDKLVVKGDTSGMTSVYVANAGGSGALTTDGIEVISVGGTSNGVFSLVGNEVYSNQQVIVAGAYAYGLYKGNASGIDKSDWYLRSVKKVEDTGTGGTDPNTGGGNTGGGNTGGGEFVLTPAAETYEAYPQALLGLNGISTLQQRVGNRFWAGNGNKVIEQGADPVGTPYATPQEAGVAIEGNGVWGRIEGAHNRFGSDSSTTGGDFRQNSVKLQAGIDGLLSEAESGKLIGGVFAQYVHGKTKISSNDATGWGDGNIATDGYGLGGTLTWYGENGFYIDAQGQATWYKSDLVSDYNDKTFVDGNSGFGYALSLEGGKRIEINPEWAVTPQAQLVYSSVKFDDFIDIYGASVSLDRGDSLQGRLGLTLDHETSWQNGNGMKNRSHIYGIADLYYEFLEGSKVNVNDLSLASRQDRVWGGLGIGGSYNWNDDKYSIFGEGVVNTSLNDFGDSYSIKGNVGFRVKW